MANQKSKKKGPILQDGKVVKMLNKMNSEVLKELKSDFDVRNYMVEVEEHFVEGYYLDFCHEEERSNFENLLLENAQPVRPAKARHYGDLCWEKFESDHSDWTEEDMQTYLWAGGGFYSLPTVEFMERGRTLFIAESQLKYLRKHPWICAVHTTYGGEKIIYTSIDEIDELIVLSEEDLLNC